MTGIDRLLLGGAGLALVAGVAAAWLLAGGAVSPPAAALLLEAPTSQAPMPGEALDPGQPEELVIDVEGAVVRPGIQRLPSGARIGDAITAAGGYSAEADLDAAARQLNLAQTLADGQQVYVPPIGAEPAHAAGGGATSGPGNDPGGGLVNVNSATPEQLDSLPGIGPVTVQKIVAGREERPFASLDEMVERKVINRGQLEKIRDLAIAS